jgi:hypothetical protein
MILANTVKEIINYTAVDIARILRRCAWGNDPIRSAKFLGLTNSGDFCFQITFDDPDGSGIGKVYLKQDAAGYVVADF